MVSLSHLAAVFLLTAGIGRPSATRYKQSRSSVNRVYSMTATLDVMPMKTKQNRIVRTGKSEAEVTNNKKTVLEVLKLTTQGRRSHRSWGVMTPTFQGKGERGDTIWQ